MPAIHSPAKPNPNSRNTRLNASDPTVGLTCSVLSSIDRNLRVSKFAEEIDNALSECLSLSASVGMSVLFAIMITGEFGFVAYPKPLLQTGEQNYAKSDSASNSIFRNNRPITGGL